MTPAELAEKIKNLKRTQYKRETLYDVGWNNAIQTAASLVEQSKPATARDADGIESIVRAVAELPDRTSPDNWPEAMLVTADELRAILLHASPSASLPSVERLAKAISEAMTALDVYMGSGTDKDFAEVLLAALARQEAGA